MCDFVINKKFPKTGNPVACGGCAAVSFLMKAGADDVCPCMT